MKKIGIIGAGISGLSLGRILNESKCFDVEILEKNIKIGGIARTQTVEGVSYHVTGGHCFNSKHKAVMDFVFEFMPEKYWNKISRDARIYLKNQFVSYPIEYSIKQINEFDPELAFNMTRDFLTSELDSPSNLQEWFVQQFGKTLAYEYFIPYNNKIWGMDSKEMSHDWVVDKLPTPNKKEFFDALLTSKKDTMPHAYFYYPKSNNQNTFIKHLSHQLNIELGYKVDSIVKKNDKWIVNNDKKYDLIINTSPMDKLSTLLTDLPVNITEAIKRLKYNKVTTMLWRSEPSEQTWTYFPGSETIFHRHIHIGNFFRPKSDFIITETIGDVSKNRMISEGEKFKFLLKPVSYNVSDHAYVVFDENTNSAKQIIKDYLNTIGFLTLGRFGEWEYYNMDICINSAMEMSKKILRDTLN